MWNLLTIPTAINIRDRTVQVFKSTSDVGVECMFPLLGFILPGVDDENFLRRSNVQYSSSENVYIYFFELLKGLVAIVPRSPLEYTLPMGVSLHLWSSTHISDYLSSCSNPSINLSLNTALKNSTSTVTNVFTSSSGITYQNTDN